MKWQRQQSPRFRDEPVYTTLEHLYPRAWASSVKAGSSPSSAKVRAWQPGASGLIFGLIRLRSSGFIGVQIDVLAQIADVNSIRRTVIPTPENRKVGGSTPPLPLYLTCAKAEFLDLFLGASSQFRPGLSLTSPVENGPPLEALLMWYRPGGRGKDRGLARGGIEHCIVVVAHSPTTTSSCRAEGRKVLMKEW